MGRNAQLLAEHIDHYLTKKPSKHISHVVYPGLPVPSSFEKHEIWEFLFLPFSKQMLANTILF